MTLEFRTQDAGDELQIFADHGGPTLERIGALSDYRGLLIFTSPDDDLQGRVMWDWEPTQKTSVGLARVKAAYHELCEDRRREAQAEAITEGAYERMMDALASQDRLDLERHDALHPDGYATPYFEAWGAAPDLEDSPLAFRG